MHRMEYDNVFKILSIFSTFVLCLSAGEISRTNFDWEQNCETRALRIAQARGAWALSVEASLMPSSSSSLWTVKKKISSEMNLFPLLPFVFFVFKVLSDFCFCFSSRPSRYLGVKSHNTKTATNPPSRRDSVTSLHLDFLLGDLYLGYVNVFQMFLEVALKAFKHQVNTICGASGIIWF